MAGNQLSQRGRTALITGASSGIGLELSKLFARDGHDLVLVARNEARLTSLARELEARFGVTARAVVCDLSAAGAAQTLYGELQQSPTSVDALVNNAGVGSFGPFAESDLAATQRMMELNMVALTELTRLFLDGMVARRRGRILNVASTAAFQPGPLMAVYYASKAYVLSFSEALANELRGSGVSVTALCPGPTRTAFQGEAHLEGSRLFSGPMRVMSPRAVAREGYRGLIQGKPVVIPGAGNAALAFAVRLSPRALVTRLSRWALERDPSGAGAGG